MNRLPFVESTKFFGGNGGATFNPSIELDWNPNLRVQKIKVAHGAMVDSVQLIMTDGMTTYEMPKLGGNGGNKSEWFVPQGEYIHRITMRYAQYLNGIQFHTNTGKSSPFFGKQTGSTADIEIRGNLLAIGGRSGSIVDAIQFFYWS